MTYKAKEIAGYLIETANQMGKTISNLKLQKILYFAWKDFYKATGEYLFKEEFEAWKFGPVVSEVYYEYCAYGWRQRKNNRKPNARITLRGGVAV